MKIIAGWSSMVACWAHNPEVAGSSPAPATIIAGSSKPVGYRAHNPEMTFKSSTRNHLIVC